MFTTPLIETITQPGENVAYTYDNVGNNFSVTRNGLTTTYAYDALGQLTRVDDPHAQKKTVYSYDMGGNITSYVEYAYTTREPGMPSKTVPYVYGDSSWKDKLTSFDGKTITYDAIGNPLTYDGWTFTWKAGRMLHSMVKDGTTVQFTYDHNGMRTKKIVNGVATEYTLNGKNIVRLKKGTDEMHFFYDAQGRPAMVRFNGTDYFYVYDLQGDVVSLTVIEGKICKDHVHMYVSIPPKMAVSEFMSYLEGKSALMFYDRHRKLRPKYADRHLWARGYYVSTIGNVNEETIREYIRNQEENDKLEDGIK